MFNPKEIYTGWRNYLQQPEVEEEVTVKRAEICSTCPLAKKGISRIFTDNKFKDIEGYYCSSCKCLLSPKIRSTGSCPENKW